MTILCAWLLADFISGIVHWYEDRAMVTQSRFAFLNGVREDNERHHRAPGYMLKYSWWGNINTTAPFAWAIAYILYFIGAPQVLTLAVFFLSFGNLVHRFAHEPIPRKPLWVSFMQATGLFQSGLHHSKHHYDSKGLVPRERAKMRYCVMTNWLNPTLDALGFFRGLDRLFGVKR